MDCGILGARKYQENNNAKESEFNHHKKGNHSRNHTASQSYHRMWVLPFNVKPYLFRLTNRSNNLYYAADTNPDANPGDRPAWPTDQCAIAEQCHVQLEGW